MEIALLIVLIVVLIGIGLIYFRLSSSSGDMDLKLKDGLMGVNSRIEESLRDGRKELQERLDSLDKELRENLTSGRSELGENIEALRKRMDERLMLIGKEVQTKLDENIREGFKQYEKVGEQLKATENRLKEVKDVGEKVSDLMSILKLPHLRGGFGEIALERLLADFLPAHLYGTQVTIGPNNERVDAVINLPKVKLPIDSKFPRESIMPLFEDSSAESLKQARKNLESVVKKLAKDIAKKYIHPEHGTTDMALMFLPSETVYFEILRNSSLWEELIRLKVLPVSPNTMIISLKTVAMSYEYYEMAEGFEKQIEEIRNAQANFMRFLNEFEKLGGRIEQSSKAFGVASRRLEKYQKSVFEFKTGKDDKKLLNEGEDEQV